MLLKGLCKGERHLVVEGAASEREDRGRLPEVVLPFRGVSIPLGSCAPGMICSEDQEIQIKQPDVSVNKHEVWLRQVGITIRRNLSNIIKNMVSYLEKDTKL